jgi:hypothetical protein
VSPSHAVLTLAGPARLDGTRPTRVDAAVRGAKSVPSETECRATAQGRHESSMSGFYSLSPILSFINTDISSTKICLNIFVFVKGNIDQS